MGGSVGGVFDHRDKLPQDLIVAMVEFPPGLSIEVVAFNSKLKLNLSFMQTTRLAIPISIRHPGAYDLAANGLPQPGCVG